VGFWIDFAMNFAPTYNQSNAMEKLAAGKEGARLNTLNVRHSANALSYVWKVVAHGLVSSVVMMMMMITVAIRC